jgi:hypothetical protein
METCRGKAWLRILRAIAYVCVYVCVCVFQFVLAFAWFSASVTGNRVIQPAAPLSHDSALTSSVYQSQGSSYETHSTGNSYPHTRTTLALILTWSCFTDFNSPQPFFYNNSTQCVLSLPDVGLKYEIISYVLFSAAQHAN